MKATTTRTVVITLELSEEEATVLCALTGAVGNVLGNSNLVAAVVSDCFEALDKCLPDRTETFTDFFQGNVKVK